MKEGPHDANMGLCGGRDAANKSAAFEFLNMEKSRNKEGEF
jgi:hypothetical protein